MTGPDAENLFNTRIFPAFKIEYPNIDNSTYFYIDETSQEIDGSGGPGIVGITKGAREQADFLVKFAIAHETAHGVVYLEHIKQGSICPDAVGQDRKKHEAWADLIATKVMLTYIPDFWSVIGAQLEVISNILGQATDSHPSGQTRVKLIKDFVAAYNQAGTSSSRGFFSSIFCCFSKSPVSTTQERKNAFNAAFKKIATAQL